MILTPKIHLLKHAFDIHFPNGKKIPRDVYSIILFGAEITLVDCGVKNSYHQIFEYIVQQGRQPHEIKRLILSHSHPDHMGSAAKIKELTGCKVLAHIEEKEWIEHIDVQCKKRPIPGFYELLDESVRIDKFLDHNQILQIDENMSLKILHSPGHSKGLINIEFVEDKILFTADSIPLKNDMPNYESYNDLMDSLEQIKKNTSFETLISSWADPLSEKSKINQLIEAGEEYIKKIDSLVNLYYSSEYESPFESCEKVIDELKLPHLFVNSIVDKAFRSHLDL